MATNIKSRVRELWGLNNDTKDLKNQQKVASMYGMDATDKAEAAKQSFNPFLKKDGSLVNPYYDYQKALDSNKTLDITKQYIQKATGLTPAATENSGEGYAEHTENSSVAFNANANPDNLVNMDVATELPKLNSGQISKIISNHFGNSKVITPADADGIFKAQQNTGMSALAILGIGALESGWGTSNIANKTNNIWGYGATNINPEGNAHRYSQMSEGASQFANEFMKTYYNGYGAKSIYSAGTGNNPKGKGYAYYDNGGINSNWATNVGSIMKTLYNTARSA